MLKRKIPFENWRVTRNEIISEMYLESTVRKNQVLIVYGVSTISEIKKIASLRMWRGYYTHFASSFCFREFSNNFLIHQSI